MKIYEVYRDRSDEYEQNDESIALFKERKDAVNEMKRIIREREKDSPFIEDVDYIDGEKEFLYYGIKERHVK